jgi:hypothetical protein
MSWNIKSLFGKASKYRSRKKQKTIFTSLIDDFKKTFEAKIGFHSDSSEVDEIKTELGDVCYSQEFTCTSRINVLDLLTIHNINSLNIVWYIGICGDSGNSNKYLPRIVFNSNKKEYLPRTHELTPSEVAELNINLNDIELEGTYINSIIGACFLEVDKVSTLKFKNIEKNSSSTTESTGKQEEWIFTFEIIKSITFDELGEIIKRIGIIIGNKNIIKMILYSNELSIYLKNISSSSIVTKNTTHTNDNSNNTVKKFRK